MNGLFRPEWSTLKKLMFLQSASGGSAITLGPAPIVSFNSTKASPMRKLLVELSPVQDLHGYDAPWPAGGGKNKLAVITDYTKTFSGGITITANKNESALTISGTQTASVGHRFGDDAKTTLPAGTYVLSSDVAVSVGNGVFVYDTATNNILARAVASIPASFTLNAETTVALGVSLPVNTPVGVIHWQLEAGSTATAWTPYENLCPISGWDSLTVYHSGADTSNPQTISISLGQTVYGGTLDVVTGVVRVTMASVDLGTLDWSLPISANPNCFTSRSILTLIKSRDGAISDTYSVAQRPSSSSEINNTPDKSIIINKGDGTTGNYPNGTIIVKDSAYASLTSGDQFKEAMSGVHLVYVLETPFTIQLTPTEVKQLVGENHVWSSAGDVTVEVVNATPIE